ncbi:dihydropteroate synthase [Pseudonocardia dioxanivorans]|uniref:dihydropteroate synthase n=1 Tax=Pseudonocardia dioxanivorans TaxID=240495 RepID=UPI001F2B080F|nr:dihydropteroate synthase [Pseudonocardia dioxanivorans]
MTAVDFGTAIITTTRCRVMGILNVTPDSFSDGGRFVAVEDAVAHGIDLAAHGADVVDVGGESTRPGAERVTAAEELRRVLPVVRGLAAAGVPTSIDTTRARVASTALEAGASMINDVSGGLADPDMARVVADADVPWVLNHWRGPSRIMAAFADYTDVVADVRAELLARVDAVTSAGVAGSRLILDPGLGFAKRPEHDLALLAAIDRIVDIGLPVLVGASRKRFLGEVLADGRAASERDAATLATSVIAARAGVWAVRVHDPAATADALRVVAALDRLS